MARTINVPRGHLILGICIPLAVLLGYLLAEPMDSGSIAVMILVVSTLIVPVLMNWHYQLLVLAWNLQMAIVFIPAAPPLWFVLAFGGLLFAVLNRAVNPNHRFTYVPSLVWPLGFFLLTVVATAAMTGGMGLHVLGGDKVGGKGYYYILAAGAGYFALTSHRIPVERANLYSAMFFLPGLTGIIGNLIYSAGPGFFFLYDFFPVINAVEQAGADMSGGAYAGRLAGLVATSAALYSFLLARHGLREILGLRRPMRLALLLLAAFGTMESGYRTCLILFLMTAGAVFVLEGLHRTRLALVLGAVGILVGAVGLTHADKLPVFVQRSISFLPVEIDPNIRQGVEASSQWRIEIWKATIPDIPRYFFQGKGYAMNPDDMDMANLTDMAAPGTYSVSAAVSGAYHNGGLSVLIPFGIFGLLGFLWFLGAGLRYLHRNYRHGDPALRHINTFLYGAFLAKSVFFFAVFGALHIDLCFFTGILGLSVALNGAPTVRREEAETPSPTPLLSSRIAEV